MIAFMEAFLGEDLSGEMPEELGEFLMSVRYWIGQDDLLTRKAVIEAVMEIEGEPFNMLINMAFSDYNQPVKIPNPSSTETTTNGF